MPNLHSDGTALPAGSIGTAELADGAVTNAKVNAAAAIDGTKISPVWGDQAMTSVITGTKIGYSITSSSTGNGITVDQNGNVGTTSSSNGAIFVENTGNTGIGLGVYSNLGATSEGSLVLFRADNAAFDQAVLFLVNDGTGNALNIQHTDTGVGVNMNHDNSGTTLDIDQDVASHTGALAWNTVKITRTNTATDTSEQSGALLKLENQVALSGGATDVTIGLEIVQDADSTGRGISITNPSAGRAFYILQSGNTGSDYGFYYDHSGTGRGALFNTSTANPLVEIQQGGTGGALFMDQNGNGIAIQIDTEATSAVGLLVDSVATGTGAVELQGQATLTGNVTDSYLGALVLDPGYTVEDAGTHTITRHNYIDVQNPSETETSGTITITDACFARFDAAAGTHKAVDAGSAHPDIDNTDAWIKMNINGTIHYVPCYTDKAA